MDTCYMHIDVNSAFLSWSAAYMLQHGAQFDLRELPSVIGGRQATRHGIVLAKSIPAKKLFGIKTGESLMEARQKAGSNLIVVQPQHDVYIMASNALMEMLGEYSPTVLKFSIDEAFIDYTGMRRLFGEPVEAAHKIKDRIKDELGFTVNVGVSTNKLLAKMACEFEKPDKVHTLWPHEIESKMWPLPIGDLYMVGHRMAAHFKRMGIFTIGDLANFDVNLVSRLYKSNGVLLHGFANGIYEETGKGGSSFFQPMASHTEDNIKGVGNSGTIAYDIESLDIAHHALLSISETVGFRLRRYQMKGSVVHVHYTTNKFERFGMQHKFLTPTNNTTEIFSRACRIFDNFWDGKLIRQIGIRVTSLIKDDHMQGSIFEPLCEQISNKKLELAIDRIRLRYGNEAILRGKLLEGHVEPMIGGTWGSGSYRPKDGMPL